MKTRRPRLAAYLRVSSQTQKNEETIYRQQENFSRAWETLQKDYDLLPRFPSLDQRQMENRCFVDDGYNLEIWDENSACHDLMTRCRRGEVNAIFVSELDRICRSRSAELRGKIKDTLEAHDVKVLTKNGEIPPGLLFELLSSVSAEDKRAILLKCHEGKISRTEREGISPNGKYPFGFGRDSFHKKWFLIPEEVKIIKSALGLAIGRVFKEMPMEIAALARAHPNGLSNPKIANALNASGMSIKNYLIRNGFRKWLAKNPTGEIRHGFIDSIFRDDRYRGEYKIWFKEAKQVGKAEYKNMSKDEKKLVIIKLPVVIENEKDWAALKIARDTRKVRAKRNVVYNYLLRRLLVCSECGAKLSARAKWGSKTRKSDGVLQEYPPTLYYVCPQRDKVTTKRCRATTCHSALELDELVWQHIKSIVLNHQIAAKIDQAPKLLQPVQSTEPYEKSLSDLQKKTDCMTQEKQRLTTLLVKNLIDENDYTQERLRIERDLRSNQKLQKQLVKQLDCIKKSETQTASVNYDKILAGFKDRLAKLSDEEKQQVTQTLLEAVKISPAGSLQVVARSFA